MPWLIFLLLSLATHFVHAQENGSLTTQTENSNAERRAAFNYQMFCQGCHSADGSGHKSVPEFKGFIHKFMATQQGREYLIRVPGAANAALDDEQLADLMNWMLRTFGDASQGASWKPFEVSEIAKYRQHPLNETIEYRAAIIAGLNLETEL